MQKFLILLDDEINRIDFISYLSKISDLPETNFNGIFGASTKEFLWINSMEDMKEISKKYPSRVITLQYLGNRVARNYREYYLDGMVQIVPARISFDDFDAELMIALNKRISN